MVVLGVGSIGKRSHREEEESGKQSAAADGKKAERAAWQISWPALMWFESGRGGCCRADKG